MVHNTIPPQKVYHDPSFIVNIGMNTRVGVYYFSADIHVGFNVHRVEAIDTTS